MKCEVTGDLVNAETNVGHFIKVLDEDLTVIEATYLSTLTELNQNIDKVNAEVDALVNSASGLVVKLKVRLQQTRNRNTYTNVCNFF